MQSQQDDFNLIDVNPFTDEFIKDEIDWMKYPILDSDEVGMSIDWEGITMKFHKVHGRCDDYLNKNFRVDDWYTPIMLIDGSLWMSLTPMEVQSGFFAWWNAAGNVGMAGLGTGYTILRAASVDQVEKVTVFERDQRAIDFFNHLHGERPECEKIDFVLGDARETCKGYEFNHFFADTYQTMLPDEVLTDIDLYLNQNDIEWYRYWGQELVQLIAINEEYYPVHGLNMVDLDYLRRWRQTEASNMYGPRITGDWCNHALHVMSQWDSQTGIDPDLLEMEDDYEEEWDEDS